MDAKKYVNAIVRKIKCDGKKKKEIKKQLLTDIHVRMKQGERFGRNHFADGSSKGDCRQL